MKKVLALLLALNAVLLFVLVLKEKEIVVHAAGGGGVPVGNGDVNGDGTIDLSDAVYTLMWLFSTGTAPVAIQCPPPAEKGLPATGQTNCYDGGGVTIDCGRADYPGQDGFYQAGCPVEGRFVDHGDGTVTDTCTGLMWQKERAPDTYSWQGALKYCEDLDFAGHTDWRLPNVRELQSIVDYGRGGPAIDPVFRAVSGNDRSSSTRVGNPDHAWSVNFDDGYVVSDWKDDGNVYVRAVRSGP